jgi:hypothetical protein
MGAFEAVAKKYEEVKQSVQEKWAGFKQKFEGAKIEMSQEVLNAKSPEDLIAAGKKLQEQGEALKLEEDSVKQEESQGEDLEGQKNEIMGGMQEEAGEMNKEFDENKAAEEAKAEAERVAAEKVADEAYALESKANDEARIAEITASLRGEDAVAIENLKQDVIDMEEIANMKQDTRENHDDFNDRRVKAAQALARENGYNNNEDILRGIRNVDNIIDDSMRKKDGSYEKLVKGGILKKRIALNNLYAYSGRF